jgi:hypothetical protein
MCLVSVGLEGVSVHFHIASFVAAESIEDIQLSLSSRNTTKVRFFLSPYSRSLPLHYSYLSFHLETASLYWDRRKRNAVPGLAHVFVIQQPEGICSIYKI